MSVRPAREDARRLEAVVAEVGETCRRVWTDGAGREFRHAQLEPICRLVEHYCLQAARFDREIREAMDRIP